MAEIPTEDTRLSNDLRGSHSFWPLYGPFDELIHVSSTIFHPTFGLFDCLSALKTKSSEFPPNHIMNNPDIDQWKAALKDIFHKSTTDATYRALALRDPIAAIREAGVEIPTGARIRFVEKLDEEIIVLPAFGLHPDILTDNDLAQVSGGGGKQVDPDINSIVARSHP